MSFYNWKWRQFDFGHAHALTIDVYGKRMAARAYGRRLKYRHKIRMRLHLKKWLKEKGSKPSYANRLRTIHSINSRHKSFRLRRLGGHTNVH